MNRFSRRTGGLIWFVALVAGGSSCSELRGRHQLREGNRLYREGRYPEAVRAYQRAEALIPDVPALWLNKGLTCQRMMTPGSRGAAGEATVSCALGAFDRLRRLRPSDPRGRQLYLQTLFDAERFQELADIYAQRLREDPSDVEAVNGMVQVYSRWNRVEEAIGWYRRKAALQPRDPEAQYAVGVYIWQQLFQRGGGADQAAFDPRPDPNQPRHHAQVKTPPPSGLGDITGPARAALADVGIRYLEAAMALRPKYDAAMTYLNLLYRQKSFAFFAEPARWQECVDAAERWRHAALAVVQTQAHTAPGRPR